MNTNARHILSATGLGLLSFTVSSALISGAFAVPTLVGFALLAVYGTVEIASLSYASPLPRAARADSTPARVSAPVLVAFPTLRPATCGARAA